MIDKKEYTDFLKGRLEQTDKLLSVKQLQISSLLEVTAAINNNFPEYVLFTIYEGVMRKHIGVEKLALIVKESEWTWVVQFGVNDLSEKISVDQDLLPYQNIQLIEHLNSPQLDDFDILIPVTHKDKTLAFSLIGGIESDRSDPLEEKLKFIQTITNLVIVAIENKKLFNRQVEQEVLKKELELAGNMQSMLIPKELPNTEIVEMAAVYLPHRDIGGDYYDVIELKNGKTAFCIGDISGKGAAAALLMANFQANLRVYIQQEDLSLEEIVAHLNQKVSNITNGEKYITFFLGLFDHKNRVLDFINAGHNPSLLVEDGVIEELKNGCTILGMFEELPFIKKGQRTLENEFVIINYTDGLTDAENESGEMFEFERLYEFVQQNYHLKMNEFNDKLFAYVSEFKGEKGSFIDDISILSCRFR